jgi:hypothetical protein
MNNNKLFVIFNLVLCCTQLIQAEIPTSLIVALEDIDVPENYKIVENFIQQELSPEQTAELRQLLDTREAALKNDLSILGNSRSYWDCLFTLIALSYMVALKPLLSKEEALSFVFSTIVAYSPYLATLLGMPLVLPFLLDVSTIHGQLHNVKYLSFLLKKENTDDNQIHQLTSFRYFYLIRVICLFWFIFHRADNIDLYRDHPAGA